MKKKTYKDFMFVFGIIVFTIMLFLAGISIMRNLFILSAGIFYSDVCKWEYGGNWTYEYNKVFGETCAEIDYITFNIIDRKPFLWSNEEINNKGYCEEVLFWDLTNWNFSCKFANQGDEE